MTTSTPARGLHLGVLADAAEDGAAAQARGRRRAARARRRSGDQLAGRGEDQRARALRRTPRAGGVSRATSGSRNAMRLAGAGAAAAEDVTAGERVGQRGGLDGSGDGDAGCGKHVGQLGGDTELDEGSRQGDSLTVWVSHHSHDDGVVEKIGRRGALSRDGTSAATRIRTEARLDGPCASSLGHRPDSPAFMQCSVLRPAKLSATPGGGGLGKLEGRAARSTYCRKPVSVLL